MDQINGSSFPVAGCKRKIQDLPKSGKVKHPPSAFLLFCKDMRESVRIRCPNLSPIDITRLLSQLWKSLDATQKTKYRQERQMIIEKFKVNHPDYNGETSVKMYKAVKNKSKKQMLYPLIQPSEVFFHSVANHVLFPNLGPVVNANEK